MAQSKDGSDEPNNTPTQPQSQHPIGTFEANIAIRDTTRPQSSTARDYHSSSSPASLPQPPSHSSLTESTSRDVPTASTPSSLVQTASTSVNNPNLSAIPSTALSITDIQNATSSTLQPNSITPPPPPYIPTAAPITTAPYPPPPGAGDISLSLLPLTSRTLPPHLNPYLTESPSLTAARLLLLLLTNGLYTAYHLHRPYNLTHLTLMRTQLLRADFFDPAHRPSELRARLRPQRILFMDLVVLVARLMRVLMRREPLTTEEERRERVEVRNACLDERFFDRGQDGGWGREGPFAGHGEGEGEDEGCFT